MKKTTPWLYWFIAMILVACLLRLGLWFSYQPMRTSDAGGYIRMGEMLANLDVSRNSGTRTPGYPLLLAMSGFNDYSTWIIQMALGMVVSALLFLFAWKMVRNAAVAFTVSLLHSMNLAQLFFEPTILAETLSTLLFLLSLGLAARMRFQHRKTWFFSAFLGFVMGIAVLTRPMFIFLVPIYLLYVWWQSRSQAPDSRFLTLIAYLLASMSLILGWSAVNWRTADYFGPTTMTGYYLMNHTGNFIEYAPDKYAVIRDIYLSHRAEQIAKEGSQTMTIWRSYFDLLTATGLSEADLSKVLTEMSMTLILQHPIQYLESVSDSWLSFWKVANYWRPENFQFPALAPMMGAILYAERLALMATNFLFLLLGVFWFWQWIRRRGNPIENHLLLLWLIVLSASLFQALLERGDNARYAVSFESIIVFTVVIGIWSFFHQGGILKLFHRFKRGT